jgi:hypothetical protein
VPNSYGLVVEGEKDALVFKEFVSRLNGANPQIRVRACGGIPALRKNFPTLLRDLESILEGRPVDKALVIRDSDGKDPRQQEADLKQILGDRVFAFPDRVHFFVVQQQMDALLLADEAAITSVAKRRGGRIVARINETIEDIVRPKERLQRELSRARLAYTPEVCRAIAAAANLETIRYRCPSFGAFMDTVTDC